MSALDMWLGGLFDTRTAYEISKWTRQCQECERHTRQLLGVLHEHRQSLETPLAQLRTHYETRVREAR